MQISGFKTTPRSASDTSPSGVSFRMTLSDIPRMLFFFSLRDIFLLNNTQMRKRLGVGVFGVNSLLIFIDDAHLK